MKVSSVEFRRNLSQYISATLTGEIVFVERNNKDTAAFLSADQLEQMQYELAAWQLGDIADHLAFVVERYNTTGPDLFRRLVMEKAHNRGDGSSKDEKLSAIKKQTDRIPDIEVEIAQIRQLIAPMLERLMSLEAARAVGCDSAEGFDDEGMEL